MRREALLGSFFAAANRSDFAFVKCPQPIEAKPRRYKACCCSNTMAPCVDAQRVAGMNRNIPKQNSNDIKGQRSTSRNWENWEEIMMVSWSNDISKGKRAFELSGWSATAASACCLGNHSICFHPMAEGYGIRYTIGIPYPQAHWMQTMYPLVNCHIAMENHHF